MHFQIVQFYIVAFLNRSTLDCIFKCSRCHDRLHRLPVNRSWKRVNIFAFSNEKISVWPALSSIWPAMALIIFYRNWIWNVAWVSFTCRSKCLEKIQILWRCYKCRETFSIFQCKYSYSLKLLSFTHRDYLTVESKDVVSCKAFSDVTLRPMFA